MYRKIISLFVLIWLFGSNATFALDFNKDVYPYSYSNFHPQNDAKIATFDWWPAKTPFENDTTGNKSYLFNTLTLHSPLVTPWYNANSYTIFPSDFNDDFSDITIHIRNMRLPKINAWQSHYFLWDKLRPVITLEYRDENNAPIYNSFELANWSFFNPMEHTVFWMNNRDWNMPIGTLSDVENNPWKWYRTKNDSSYAYYSMDINLPMAELSQRVLAFDEQLKLSWINKKLEKLKYIKVKLSLISMWSWANWDWESYLSCSNLNTNKLGYWEYSNSDAKELNVDFWGLFKNDLNNSSEIKENDKYNIVFQNWTKFNILNPVTLWKEIYNWLNSQVQQKNRNDFQLAVNQIIETKHLSSNMKLIDKSTFTLGSSYAINKKDYEWDFLEPETLTYWFIKGDFAIEDCLKLAIKKQTTIAWIKKWYRLDYLQWDTEKPTFTDWIDCTNDNVNYNCNDSNWDNDWVMYKSYSAWNGFGYEPFWLSSHFSSVYSLFKYNIWISSNPPNVVVTDGSQAELNEQLKNLKLPYILGSPAWNYDWKNEKPIFSKYSFSANLKEKEKEKIRKNALSYCETTWDTNNCLSIHWLQLDSDLKIIDENPITIEPLDPLYKDTLDINNPRYRDNYWEANINPWVSTNKTAAELNNKKSYYWYQFNKNLDTHTQIENVYAWLSSNAIWQYVYSNKFFSAIPKSIINNIQRSNNNSEINWNFDLKKSYDQTKDNWVLDDSFNWQTFFPFDTTWEYSETRNWMKRFWYNLSVLKWSKYLYFWTYDLDKDANLGTPPTDISIKFRPAYINSDLSESSYDYIKHWPKIILIDWTWQADWKDDMIDRVKIWQLPIYYTSNWYKIARNINWNPGSWLWTMTSWIDEYGWWNKSFYQISWPEWNNQTSFYKFDLKKLYEEFTNWNNEWPEDDKKFFKDWEFDTDGSLKKNILLRIVVKNPDINSSNSYSPNVLYFLSNWMIWNLSKQLDDDHDMSLNLELIHSDKQIFQNISWYTSSYIEIGTGSLQPRYSDIIEEEHTLITTYRLKADWLFKKDIINPYLIEDTNSIKPTNLTWTGFTTDEIAQLKKIRILPDEAIQDIDLWHSTSNTTSAITIEGKTYNKICKIPTSDAFKSITNKDWNIKSKIIPDQYVCYYVDHSISSADLDNLDFRRVTTTNDKYLPFVDIYVKKIVDKSSNLVEIKEWSYVYNILNSSYGFKNINIKNGSSFKKDTEDLDDDWDTNEKFVKKLPQTYEWLVIEENKDSILVKTNRDRLDWATIIDRFNFVDYTSLEAWKTADEKKLRTTTSMFIYFDKLQDWGTDVTFEEIKEYNKYNNQAISFKNLIWDWNFISWEPLTLTWDYPKTNSDNDDSVLPIPDDWFTLDPLWVKDPWDTVVVYPKIINNSQKEICELTVTGFTWMFDEDKEISLIDNWDNQLINDTDTSYVESTNLIWSWTTVWIDWTIQSDLINSKDFKYRYRVDGINNKFWYTVKYKFCWEETSTFNIADSKLISFKLSTSLPWPGTGLCNLNSTTPTNGTDIKRWWDIDYKVTCFNNTWYDIYNLRIKLPLPSWLEYKEWIDDNWVSLWSLNWGQTIDYNTNPLDMIKKTEVKDEAPLDWIPAILEYKYYETLEWWTEIDGTDNVIHRVIASSNDQTTVKILRWSCNWQSEFAYNPGWQNYPFLPVQWMCSSKIPKTDEFWNKVYDQDNKACLIVKYYRIGDDTLANPWSKVNNTPELYWGQTARNTWSQYNWRCTNTVSWWEWQMRSKYVNVKVNMDVDLPNGYILDWTTLWYTDYNATINNVNQTTINITEKKYRYLTTISSSGESEWIVKNNTFQKVLRTWANDLSKALIELRIPLKAINKWNSLEDAEKMEAKVDNSQISFDRKLWERKDTSISCRKVCTRYRRWSCRSRTWQTRNDWNSTEYYYWMNTNESFNIADDDKIPVCISSDWKWFQVLNGWLYVKDLKNLEDIEHQIDPSNPASYNTNWFYNQDNYESTPGWFMKFWWDWNDILNLDYQYATNSCYKVKDEAWFIRWHYPENEIWEYDYDITYEPDVSTDYQCNDWTTPWFYSIVKWDYGYVYSFNKTQLKDIASTTIDLEKDYDANTKIKDRVWLYERDIHWEDLVIWKDNLNEIKIKWKWSIFITKTKDDLSNKGTVLNINSNVIYDNTTIVTGSKVNEYDWDALAIVVNWDMKISSKVTRMEWLYFVDWDVYVEESKQLIDIDRLYVTWDIYVKRNATVWWILNSWTVDKYTNMEDAPVFRISGSTRYLFIQPSIFNSNKWYYKEIEVPANDLNIDCTVHWLCN